MKDGTDRKKETKSELLNNINYNQLHTFEEWSVFREVYFKSLSTVWHSNIQLAYPAASYVLIRRHFNYTTNATKLPKTPLEQSWVLTSPPLKTKGPRGVSIHTHCGLKHTDNDVAVRQVFTLTNLDKIPHPIKWTLLNSWTDVLIIVTTIHYQQSQWSCTTFSSPCTTKFSWRVKTRWRCSCCCCVLPR